MGPLAEQMVLTLSTEERGFRWGDDFPNLNIVGAYAGEKSLFVLSRDHLFVIPVLA